MTWLNFASFLTNRRHSLQEDGFRHADTAMLSATEDLEGVGVDVDRVRPRPGRFRAEHGCGRLRGLATRSKSFAAGSFQ